MANQPLPSRPWPILGSVRPVAPPPAPEAQPQLPAPRRPIFRPTFGQAFRPTTRPPPQPLTAATAAPPFWVGNVSSVPSNPKLIYWNPLQIKPPSPLPSALTLPPARAKSTHEPIEQKILQKPNPPFKLSNGVLGDTAKPSIFPNYEKRELTKDMESKDHKGNHKKADSEDASMEVITVAGDNKGAIMELSLASSNKLGSDTSGNYEEKSKKMDKTENKMGTPSPPMSAFVNSNVQAINNSILFNTSLTHHDPGVHVFFSGGGGRGLHLKDCGDGQNN
ncbi:hypothetical protein AAG906_005282 [Vitis piasezkii]